MLRWTKRPKPRPLECGDDIERAQQQPLHAEDDHEHGRHGQCRKRRMAQPDEPGAGFIRPSHNASMMR
jgi:hypothetical protein